MEVENPENIIQEYNEAFKKSISLNNDYNIDYINLNFLNNKWDHFLNEKKIS